MTRIFITFFFLSFNIFPQWFPVSSGTSSQLNKLAFSDHNTGFAVGISSVIIKTTNGGINWVNVPNTAGVNLWNLFFTDSSTVMVCGDNVMIRSTNLGNSWNNIPVPSSLYRGINFTDYHTGYACGTGGVIIRTTNGGINWNTLTSGTSEFLFGISFVNSSTGYCCGYNGILLKTTNNGNSWFQLTTGVTDNIISVFAVNSDTLFACTANGKILRSINGGSNWIQQNSGTTQYLSQIYFLNSKTGSVCGFSNIILRTTNAGANWHLQEGLSGQGFLGIRFINIMTGFTCGTNGTILKTTTGGFPFPSQPNLISPPNGANGISLSPLLDWDSVSSAKTYRLQLSADSTFGTTLIDSSDIVYSFLNVIPGILTNNTLYFWRVRGINAAGQGPWSSAYRFRTIVALPSPPNLIVPANNSSGISLTPFFDWDSTSPANFYRLQISVDSTFSITHADITGITISEYNLSSPPLSSNFRYYWRVNATNDAGTGPWSLRFNFTTVTGTPAPPVLFSPPNNAMNVSLTPLLDWNEDISVISYQLQLSTDSLFNSFVIDSSSFTASELSVRPGLLTNLTSYFWRVRTTNTFGTSQWSSAWKFTTLLAPPGAPLLISPPNNDTGVSTTPVLDWNDVQYAQTYRVQLSTDSTFGSTIINIGGLTTSNYNVPGGFLSNNTRYYWRVNATNSAGTGPWSATWNFRTVISPPVAPPVLISPPNGATGQSLTPLLDWNDVFQAQGYRVHLSQDSLFNSLLIDTSLPVSNYTVRSGVLNGNTTYYWRVRAFNSGGFGPWSVTWRFTTQPIGIIHISSEIPDKFSLSQYPNPFNPVTRFIIEIPSVVNVKISIFDINGKLTDELYNGMLSAGKYQILWDASHLSSGLYFCRFSSDKFSSTLKIIYLK